MTSPIVVGRLAPSPTGAQHVGNARTYLLAWLSVRSRGGKIALRIEDVDSPRVKAGAADSAVEDLRWLGLDWNEGPVVQTQRLEIYQAAFETLQRAEKVYPCTCSRSDVAAAASAPHAGHEGPSYPGTCAGRSARDVPDRPHCWRFRSSDEPSAFVDRFAGPQRATKIDRGGDFIVYKSDRTPAYQLAVVADDAAMGITEVLRGDDLIPSTFRQLELYRFFGWRTPEFAHVPLVVGPDGRRLAKRHGDTRLDSLRKTGVAAEALLGMLACSSGLTPTPAPISARELIDDFSLDKLNRSPLVLTRDLLKSIGYDAEI